MRTHLCAPLYRCAPYDEHVFVCVLLHKQRCCAAALVVHHAPPKKKSGKSLLGGSDEAVAGATDATAIDSATPPPDLEPSASLDATTDGSDGKGDSTEQPAGPWVPYFKPNLTISMVNEHSVVPSTRMPPAFAEQADISMDLGRYYPVVHISEFWLLRVRRIHRNASESAAHSVP